MFEAVGVPVSRLIRIQYGDLVLPPRLRPGKWNMLTAEEAEALAVSLSMPSKKSLAETSPARAAFRSGTRSSPLRGQTPRTDQRTETQEDTRRKPGARTSTRASEPRPSTERKTFVVRGGRAERQETVSIAEGRPVARSLPRAEAGRDMKRGAVREPGRASERATGHENNRSKSAGSHPRRR